MPINDVNYSDIMHRLWDRFLNQCMNELNPIDPQHFTTWVKNTYNLEVKRIPIGNLVNYKILNTPANTLALLKLSHIYENNQPRYNRT